MIRNVVMGKLAEDATKEQRSQLAEGLAGIKRLKLDGLLETKVGMDENLRAGGWDFAITNDWVDAAAYQAYDVDEEHLRYRAMIVSACEQLARVQFYA